MTEWETPQFVRGWVTPPLHLASRGGYCHNHDTWSTLYHSIWSCACIYLPFHHMYLCFPIITILLVSPLISKHSVYSISLYGYLICFHLWFLVTLCSCPDILTNTICLGESVTYITELIHHAVQTALIIICRHAWPPEHHLVHWTIVFKPMYSVCYFFSSNIKSD